MTKASVGRSGSRRPEVVVADANVERRRALVEQLASLGFSVALATTPLELLWVLDGALVVFIGELRGAPVGELMAAIQEAEPGICLLHLPEEAAAGFGSTRRRVRAGLNTES
jgi:hypothetical protein